MSIRPGNRVAFGRSITLAPAGTVSPFLPTEVIRPSVTMTSGLSTYLPDATSNSRAALTAVTSAALAPPPTKSPMAAARAAASLIPRIFERPLR